MGIGMSKSKERKRLGRPPTGITPSRSVRLSPAIWRAIDLWQHTQADRPILTSSGAVRQLLIIALTGEGIVIDDDNIPEAAE
jgi:hypothetical protein